MKKNIWLISGLLVVALLSPRGLSAQENQEKIKQKELQKKQQNDLKKQQKELDSITEKAKAEYDDELKQLFEEQKKLQAESKELNTQIFIRGDRSTGRASNRDTRFFYGPSASFFSGSGDNTTFTISKRIEESLTFTGDFEYEVPDNVTGLYFDFGSELDAGTLKISITKPGGKVFQTFSVAPVANVDWNKNLKVKEGESKDYSGTWKITISTKDAKGYYELKINSY